MIATKELVLSAPDKPTKDRAVGIFEALLRSGGLDRVFQIDSDLSSEADGSYVIKINGLDEDAHREFGHSVDTLLLRSLETAGIHMPNVKTTLEIYEQAGITFAGKFRRFLAAMEDKYQAAKTTVRANYLASNTRGLPEGIEPRKEDGRLVTDAAPWLQVVRDAFAPLITRLRWGAHHNRRAHPDQERRLVATIDAKRPKASPADTLQGPGVDYLPSTVEKTADKALSGAEDALRNPAHALLQVIPHAANLLGGVAGVAQNLVIGSLRHLPKTKGAIGRVAHAARERGDAKQRSAEQAVSLRLDAVRLLEAMKSAYEQASAEAAAH